jgi:hypothetical protein
MLSEYRTVLLSLFESLQRVQADPLGRARDAWDIQNTLIEQISAAEGRISTAKQLAAALRSQLSTPRAIRLTKDQAREVKEAIASHAEAVEADQCLIGIFRDVGDGLAFTYVDKWDIKPMAFKESPGFLSGKEGLAAELAIVRKAFDVGGIAILNDLTNCLRYGDVTMMRDAELSIVEAKSGRTMNQRAKRQLAANDKISEYLQTGRSAGLYGIDYDIRRVGLAHPEVNHAPTLQQMIDEALQRRGCYRQVEPGLHYMVNTDVDIESFMPAREALDDKLYVCMVNMLKGHNTAYFPFTLSICNPEHLYAFYNGDLIITIAVQLGYVSRYFSARGLTASFHRDEPWFLVVDKNEPAGDEPSAMHVGFHIWDRIFAEFLSLDWLLNEITTKCASMNALGKCDSGHPV